LAPRVLVTGVSGFLGAHCAQQLLAAGYRVRGTVRSLKDERKVAHVRALKSPDGSGVELVEADLLSAACWVAAVSGCEYVLHVASPFPADIPKRAEDIIAPAVEGTLHVLRAVAADPAHTVRRVVLTSSIAALFSGRDQLQKTWDQGDWGTLDDPSNKVHPYPASKVLAEQAAWKFVKEQPASSRFELATICPGLMCGPYLGGVPGTSAETTLRLLKRSMPAVPDMIFPGADVRDIARLHILAMQAPGVAGQRFIGVSFNFGARAVAQLLAAEFGPLGYRVTTRALPNWLFRILARFDSSMEAISVHIGLRPTFDVSPAQALIGQQWIGLEKSVVDQAYSLIANGVVADQSTAQALTTPDANGASQALLRSHVREVSKVKEEEPCSVSG
jgi:nucleoside-diphosphate-sugar epimerase